jgi:hypothetical protein
MSERNFTANSPCTNHDLNEESLCRYCDSETVKDHAHNEAVELYGEEYSADQYNEIYSKIYSSTGLCWICQEEELADFRDDD